MNLSALFTLFSRYDYPQVHRSANQQWKWKQQKQLCSFFFFMFLKPLYVVVPSLATWGTCIDGSASPPTPLYSTRGALWCTFPLAGVRGKKRKLELKQDQPPCSFQPECFHLRQHGRLHVNYDSMLPDGGYVPLWSRTQRGRRHIFNQHRVNAFPSSSFLGRSKYLSFDKYLVQLPWYHRSYSGFPGHLGPR